ncbi:hypothetical protein C8A01DRAFT_32636 [Parachaetomium inaequale]|uniref:Uncharacterized protein n=1 Tax=Parachaetomium inaequale TaxID=2588326 RepID=A0AAN6PLU2_9PEZI|nr:hypothetical protein C8A01DRAFT_32636 [Parachaetomium inaequale]
MYSYPLPVPGWDDDGEVRVSPELANTSSDYMYRQRATARTTSPGTAPIQADVTIREQRSTVLKFGNTEIQDEDGAEMYITPGGGNPGIWAAGRDRRSSYIAPDDGRTSVNVEDCGQPPNTSSSSVSVPAMEPRDAPESLDFMPPLGVPSKPPRPVQTPGSWVPTSSSPSWPGATAPHNYDYPPDNYDYLQHNYDYPPHSYDSPAQLRLTLRLTSPPRPVFSSREQHQVDRGPRPPSPRPPTPPNRDDDPGAGGEGGGFSG